MTGIHVRETPGAFTDRGTIMWKGKREEPSEPRGRGIRRNQLRCRHLITDFQPPGIGRKYVSVINSPRQSLGLCYVVLHKRTQHPNKVMRVRRGQKTNSSEEHVSVSAHWGVGFPRGSFSGQRNRCKPFLIREQERNLSSIIGDVILMRRNHKERLEWLQNLRENQRWRQMISPGNFIGTRSRDQGRNKSLCKSVSGKGKKCMFVLSPFSPWIHPSVHPSVPFLLWLHPKVSCRHQYPSPQNTAACFSLTKDQS